MIRPALHAGRGLWRSRWGVLRLCIASFLLWCVAAEMPARWARLRLESLPGFDYAAEVAYLREAGRFGESLMVADEGEHASDAEMAGPAGGAPGSAERRAALAEERRKTVEEQSSYWRKAKAFGMGALSGQGHSLEELLGAIAADFLIVGDVRDLVIQSGRLALDGDADEVVLALSAVGLATTAAPEIDWAPSILKAAKKAGTLTKGMSAFVMKAAKAGRVGELKGLLGDVRKIASRASPGGAMRMLGHADNPAELSAIARFVDRERAGAFALHVTAGDGATLVKDAAKGADGVADAAAIDRAVIAAARKGPAGVAWLRSGGWRVLVKPHPLVGVLKGLWKGNIPEAIPRLLERLGAKAWWVLPLLAAWVFVEGTLIAGRLVAPRRPAERAEPAVRKAA